MKRLFLTLVLALAALTASSCLDTIKNDLDVLERRVAALEEKCQNINQQIDALNQIVTSLEQYDFITKVETLRDGVSVIGYRIYFTHSDPITLINGEDAGTPLLGVAKAEDGMYYWTVLYPGSDKAEFVRDNFGQLVSASAASPELKIENGYWFISYDGGKNWSNLGKATADDGATFFSDVVVNDNYILFKLVNGTEIKVPTWASYEKLNQACETANKNLIAFTQLAEALKQKVYASDIQPIVEGSTTIGYRLFLSDGSSYAFYNGIATNAPVIGSARDPKHPTDTSFYWTIQYSGQSSYTWLLDEKGKKIRADASPGQAVQLTVLPYGSEGKYYWAVAYGDGEPQFLLYNGEMVEASAEVPDGVVTRVVVMEDNRVFVMLSDKQYVYIPMAPPVDVTLDAPVVSGRISMNALETVSFKCHIPSATSQYEVLPVTSNGFYAIAERLDATTWNISVTAPSTFTSPNTGQLNLIISTGTGIIKTVTVTILHK